MVLQFLAALAGIVVAGAAHVQVNSSLGNFLNSDYNAWSLPGMGLMTVKYLIIGVMVSGGVARWEHALHLVGGLETGEEKQVAQWVCEWLYNTKGALRALSGDSGEAFVVACCSR